MRAFTGVQAPELEAISIGAVRDGRTPRKRF
jgi:hypothetical protein